MILRRGAFALCVDALDGANTDSEFAGHASDTLTLGPGSAAPATARTALSRFRRYLTIGNPLTRLRARLRGNRLVFTRYVTHTVTPTDRVVWKWRSPAVYETETT